MFESRDVHLWWELSSDSAIAEACKLLASGTRKRSKITGVILQSNRDGTYQLASAAEAGRVPFAIGCKLHGIGPDAEPTSWAGEAIARIGSRNVVWDSESWMKRYGGNIPLDDILRVTERCVALTEPTPRHNWLWPLLESHGRTAEHPDKIIFDKLTLDGGWGAFNNSIADVRRGLRNTPGGKWPWKFNTGHFRDYDWTPEQARWLASEYTECQIHYGWGRGPQLWEVL